MYLYKMGHKFGDDGTLHRSKSRHPKYYLTESKEALLDLQMIRNQVHICNTIK